MIAELARQGMPILDAYAQGAAVHLQVAEMDLGKYEKLQGKLIQPSLEDVFVHFVKQKRQEVAA